MITEQEQGKKYERGASRKGVGWLGRQRHAKGETGACCYANADGPPHFNADVHSRPLHVRQRCGNEALHLHSLKINVYMKHTLLLKILTPQGYRRSVRCSAQWV